MVNRELWEVIQLFQQKEIVGQAEWAYAEEVLDKDTFQLFELHMQEALYFISDPWI